VGINSSGLIPAVMLSNILTVPLYTLKVSLKDDDCDHNCWMSEDALGYDTPRNILIVDAINDTGATYAWIKKDWPASCLPNSENWNNVWGQNVRFAALVDNLSSKENIDFSVIEINNQDQITFPWEVK
jgi:hypothetical protein